MFVDNQRKIKYVFNIYIYIFNVQLYISMFDLYSILFYSILDSIIVYFELFEPNVSYECTCIQMLKLKPKYN